MRYFLLVIVPFFAFAMSVASQQAPLSRIDPSHHDLFNEIFALEQAAATSGWTVETLQQVGNLWEAVGDDSRAIAYWERANAIAPTEDVLRRLTLTYINEQRFQTALSTLAQLRQQLPNDSWATYYTALILAPTSPAEALTYVEPLIMHEVYGTTMQDLYAILKSAQPDFVIINDVAALYASRRLWPIAEYAFQYAADTFEPFPDALAYVGLMRAMQNKNSQSVIAEALALDPLNSSIRMIAGIERRINQDYETSLSAIFQALAIEPTNPVLYSELSLSYTGLGLHDEAHYWDTFSRLLQGIGNVTEVPSTEETPPLPDYLPGVGLSEDGLNNLADSVEAEADNQWIRAVYGWALIEQGKASAGETLIDAAFENSPEDLRIAFLKARILYQQGQTEAAIALLQEITTQSDPIAEIARPFLNAIQ